MDYRLGLALNTNCLDNLMCSVLQNLSPTEILNHFWWFLNKGEAYK